MLKNGFKTVKIKTLPISKTPIIKGIQSKHQIVDSVNESITIDLTKNRSIKDIAQDNNVSSSTVLPLSSFFTVSRHWLPRAICLDDFKSGSHFMME